MKRAIYANLLDWKQRPSRLPMLLRGARQVGKTHLVEQLGNAEFEQFHSINFELEPSFKDCFKLLDPTLILEQISALTGKRIKPGQDLLFLDEVQICPRAIVALRYFKEKMPKLHVIAAGSLLEFVLRDEEISVPVGRVEYMYVKPLSFYEFLIACDQALLIEQIEKATVSKPISEAIHNKLLSCVRDYMIVGGMPAAVKAFIDSRNFEATNHQQTIILTTYRDDFGKYAKQSDHKYLQKIFMQTPAFIGQQIQYSKLDPDSRSRDLKRAITTLAYADVIHSVYCTSASGLPLNALINEKKFKLLFLDTGLVSRSMRLTIHDLTQKNILVVNRGAMAEQWAGQELIAYMDKHERAEIHYWARDKRGSMAEVDYVITVGSNLVPIEVKAGKTGSLKSLRMLMKDKTMPLGVRISEQELKLQGNILTLPFYLISQLNRITKELLSQSS